MVDFNNYDDPIEDLDEQDVDDSNDTSSDVSTYYDDDYIGQPDDAPLEIPEDDLDSLEEDASDIDRSEADRSKISFGRKMCPTRGGCQGATDCDYSYGSYPG